MAARMPDEGHGGLDGQAESGPARNVQREVSAHVNTGEADDRHGSGNDSAPGRAQSQETAVPRATATPACPDRYPSPDASRPRVRAPPTSAAGRGRRTICLTSLDRPPAVHTARTAGTKGQTPGTRDILTTH